MVRIRELKLSSRLFAATYRWRRVDPVPALERSRPLRECRIAVVSTAGLVLPGDPPFDPEVRGGDWSFRVVPRGSEVGRLEEHHRSDAFDHSGIAADRNLGMPLDRLGELQEAGEIGAVAPRHVSLMGSITAPGRLGRDTLPEVVGLLLEDQVDVALLVPV